MVEFIQDKALGFDDVLIVPQPSSISSRAQVELKRKFKFLTSEWTGVPIIAANMQNIGTLKVAKILSEYGMLTALVKGTESSVVWSYTFETFGRDDDIPINSPLICLDVANGYMKSFVHRVRQVRICYPQATIMAGNVVTDIGVWELVNAGADIIKVGLGSGSACLTRQKTGVGYPQLQAVIDCAEEAHKLGAYICSDGGHRTPGDAAKSFAAGADFVMLGGMFAGTDETSSYLKGNALQSAFTGEWYKTAEGKEILIPYKGSLKEVVQDLLGGLRSACSYVGASSLKEFQEKATFVRVT